MYITLGPLVLFWIYYAIRTGRLFFFTATNPGLSTGGFFGESKSEILKPIPADSKPKTILVKTETSIETLSHEITAAGISFPMIAKPEVGERGWLVQKVYSFEELNDWLLTNPVDMLIQEFVSFPLELSIFIHTMPQSGESKLTSICEKRFLQIKGNGRDTVGKLILSQDRAVLQYEKLVSRFGDRWNEIISDGEVLILEEVGNHCRGTMFLDKNEQIDDNIRKVMQALLSSLPGVYYGRFDLRVPSWNDLRQGKNIRVMEFNGTSAEPAHIYQPGYSIWQAFRDYQKHWGIMAQIARENLSRGHKADGFGKIISDLRRYLHYKRNN